MSKRPTFILNDPAMLATHVGSQNGRLFVFDGRPGAGKSYVARMTAKALDGTFIDADNFLTPKQRMFVGALRIQELRSAIASASTPPVLLATDCAREVVKLLGLPVASMIWIERASLVRLDQIERDYFDNDDGADNRSSHVLHKEVEAYITAHDARRTADVVYLNAPD